MRVGITPCLRVVGSLTLAAMVVGCGESTPEGGTGFARDSAGIAITETDVAPAVGWSLDSAARVEVGGASSGAVDLFRVVAALRLDDGRIIVAEGSPPRLLAFDARGALLRTAGRRGAGPGEFEAIAWLQRVAGDSLLLYDPRLRRASVFDDSLHFARSFSLPNTEGGGVPPLVGSFEDRSLLATTQRVVPPPAEGGMVRPKLVLWRHRPDGTSPDSLATVVGNEAAVVQGIIARPSFAKRTQLAVGADEFTVATAERFELMVFGQDGRLRRIFRRSLEPIPVAESEVAKFGLAELEGTMTYPSIEAVLLDGTGNTWVKEHQRADSTATWVVFDSVGRLLGAMHPPRGFEPFQIGADFVLGVWRDEAGEESVRLYDLIGEDHAP